MEKVIIWIHIPKTGGKSVVKMLEQKYKTLQVYQTRGGFVYDTNEESLTEKIVRVKDVKTLNECMKYASYNRYEAIIGNLVAKEALNSALNYYGEVELYCVIREPLERTYSEYCHNSFHFNMKTDYETFCKAFPNTIHTHTSGNLDLFKFVGLFQNFHSDMIKLGFVVEHENKSDGKPRIEVDKSIATKYNLLDIDLYNNFLKINGTNT